MLKREPTKAYKITKSIKETIIMKKMFQSKGFTAIILAILCVIIIILCLMIRQNKSSEFVAEESTPTSNIADITTAASSENTTAATTVAESSGADAYQPAPTSESKRNEDYPKIISETDKEVSINFTSTTKATETTPPAPEGKTIIEDPAPDHPVNPTPEETVSPTEVPASAAPEAGSTNENGAIYDPVFGWVKPVAVEQSLVDSEGDPNKMVGNMGE